MTGQSRLQWQAARPSSSARMEESWRILASTSAILRLNMAWGTKTRMPRPEEALPGRATRMPVPERHFVLGTPLEPPFPAGTEKALFGLGCFWGAEKEFWKTPGVYTTAVGYAGGSTPNPTYREVCSGLTGHNEVVLVVFDAAKVGYPELLRLFFESHDPTQGMRQGNDVGTQYRSGIYTFDEAQRSAAVAAKEAYEPALRAAGLGAHHDRDRARAGVLLRGGLPPAVPREEPGWLLRPRGNRRGLSGRAQRRPDLIAPSFRRWHGFRAFPSLLESAPMVLSSAGRLAGSPRVPLGHSGSRPPPRTRVGRRESRARRVDRRGRLHPHPPAGARRGLPDLRGRAHDRLRVADRSLRGRTRERSDAAIALEASFEEVKALRVPRREAGFVLEVPARKAQARTASPPALPLVRRATTHVRGDAATWRTS